MKIIGETACISVEEHEEYGELSYASAPRISWEAELSAEAITEPGPQKMIEGLSVRTESASATVTISLKRYADTPDEAVKALFEAMGDAGITL